MPEFNKTITFTEIIEEKIKALEMKETNNSAFKGLLDEKTHYLYLPKNQISEPLHPSIKQTLKNQFFLEKYAGIQIIGDSAAFESSATEFLQNELAHRLKNFDGLIFYGFTGEGANGILSDLLSKQLLSPAQVIANMVANESLEVIKKYNCKYSAHVQNFLIVGDGNGGCKFGDDINLSDQLAEQLICLEGGVICLGQLINTLIYHEQPHITIYTALRNQDNLGLERPLFSAGELLIKFKSATDFQEIETIFHDYLQNHRFNPKDNEENQTKHQQIHQYFQKFKQLKKSIQNQVIEKIKHVKHQSFTNKNFKENNVATLFFTACESAKKPIHAPDRVVLTLN